VRLYHFTSIYLWLSLTLVGILVACTAPQVTQAVISVKIIADGQTVSLSLPAGSTVQQALDIARLSLNTLDRTEPAVYTVLGGGDTIRLIRVSEEFEVEQEIIPFERQTLRNESLSQDKEILIQAGKNGLREITYHRVYENGVEVSSQPIPVKSVIVNEPLPEIVMIGIQAPLSPVAISGRIYYIRDGNLWALEGDTGNRRAIITTGDLDGRIFSLSQDGSWLLFTRRSTISQNTSQINSLWAVNLTTNPTVTTQENLQGIELIDLKVSNVIHFADWLPGSNVRFYFSTVEPRSAAPGWQANNDLNFLTFSNTGWTTRWAILIEPNAGGIYGWWGTSFLWNQDGSQIAYARPDSVGVINPKDGKGSNLLDIIPLRTRGDWAWVPGIAWSPDGKFIFTVDHVSPAGSNSPEESQLFDLTVIPLQAGPVIHLVPQVGMFAYPLISPQQKGTSDSADYQVAFLQAIFPNQSETSRYRLALIDRDGSNLRTLFPDQEATGLDPQRYWGAWSPDILPESGHYALAVLYQGNLWLVDTLSGEAQQITSDGLTNRILWTTIPKSSGE
jgi:hypothetical protein